MVKKHVPQKEPRESRWDRFLASIPFLKELLPEGPQSIQNVGNLVDVFATFSALDGTVDRNEANVALDLLRHAFPEADHGWLSRRLQRGFRSPSTVQQVAQSISPKLSTSQKTSLGLQLYLLVDASTAKSKGQAAFAEFMTALGEQHTGELIQAELSAPSHDSDDLPFEKLSFSNNGDVDIALPESKGDLDFCIFRSGQVLLLKNQGSSSLQLGGSTLLTGSCTRLRPHQRLLLPGWTLTYSDLNFFFDAKTHNHQHRMFVATHDGGFIAERNRSRGSLLRLTFGLKAEVKVLTDSDIFIQGHESHQAGEKFEVPHFSRIHSGLGTSSSLNQLRKQSYDSGGRIKLGEKQCSCLISNQPEKLGSGDLLLSSELADPVLIKVTFDQIKGTGKMEILEQVANTILVNGVPAAKHCDLQDGCLIRLSPNQGIRCRFTEGLLDEERTIIQQLQLDGLSHHFRSKTALDNIDLSIQRGEMLCIMGPSGSGKSTLLSSIAGQLAPSRGHVRINGISLYQHHSRLTRFITYMPQEEALSSLLTVREHIRFAVSLRQPGLNTQGVRRRVDTILDELSLQPLANRKVGNPDEKSLSGGERSRLNLGLDLGSKAEIFLFDEPISGLSSKDAEHVAESLKDISRDKIVIASLHRPGSNVLSQFQKVLLLDSGGRVAFFGSPNNMVHYFKEACKELQINPPQDSNENSADFVFDVLETPMVDLVSSHKFTTTRRFPPLFWQERFEGLKLIEGVESGEVPAQTQIGDLPRADDNMPIPKKRKYRLNEYYRIYKAHFKRSAFSKFRNKGTIYATLLEAPLLALLISWTLRASAEGSYEFSSGLHIITYLFLSVTVGMFLGLTNSATEILRDRPTLRRERNCRYYNSLYVGAKFSVLALLAAVQSAIYITIGNWMLEIEGMWLDHWLWMTITALCGTAIALAISAFVRTERAALSSVPLILVPQLLLAGTPLIPFEEMNRALFSGAEEARSQGIEPIPSRVIPLRYAYEGVIVNQATQNPFSKVETQLQKKIEALKNKSEILMTFKNEGLKEKDSERLATLLVSKTLLNAAEAMNKEQAILKIQKIAHLGMHGTIQELEDLEIYNKEGEPISCASYFVNERADGLVLRQDIQRLDLTKESKPNIFLAKKKYWGTEVNEERALMDSLLTEDEFSAIETEKLPPVEVRQSWRTHYVCFGTLALTTIVFVGLSTMIVTFSNKKTR